MAKAKQGEKNTEPQGDGKPKRKRQMPSGGFQVFEVVVLPEEAGAKLASAVADLKGKEALIALGPHDLPDTQAALAFIREGATSKDWNLNGRTLVIAQVKRRLTVKVEKVEKVVIE